jgi:hypothetical protein
MVLQMALPCHPTAQKCHPSKLLQAKLLRDLGEESPILPMPRSYRVGELSAVLDQMLDSDLEVDHYEAALPRHRPRRLPSRNNDALSVANNFTICSAPSPKPRCIIPSSIPNRELLS